jgi:hypothetical protein
MIVSHEHILNEFMGNDRDSIILDASVVNFLPALLTPSICRGQLRTTLVV